MSGISRDEWLAALDEAGLRDENDDDAITVNEFARLMGLTRWMATLKLRALVEMGKAAETHKRVTRSDGHRVRAQAYRLLERQSTRSVSDERTNQGTRRHRRSGGRGGKP